MHRKAAHYAHTMPMRLEQARHISRLELVESLDSRKTWTSSPSYMSDSDLMGKTMTEDEDITTG